ncbi:hypothetical protein ACH4GK_34180 [Streptomyces rimosus]|nr:hypothetical protein [Streptomyces rimosus]
MGSQATAHPRYTQQSGAAPARGQYRHHPPHAADHGNPAPVGGATVIG